MIFQSAIRIVILLLFTLPFSGFGQYELKVKRFSSTDGLFSSFVYEIIQDHQGFIWLATAGGLTRYDGNEFVVFKNIPGDSTSLSNDYVTTLYEDIDHNLWVGTNHGLNLFNRKTGRFKRFLHNSTDSFSISNDRIRTILQDKRKNFWVGTAHGGLNQLELDNFRFSVVHFSDVDRNVSIYASLEDSNQNVWVGSNNGLYAYDSVNNVFNRIPFPIDKLHFIINEGVRSIYEDREKKLWFGGFEYLYRFDPIRETWDLFSHDPANLETINGGYVGSVCDYDDDHILIASSRGLSICSRETNRIKRLSISSENIHSPIGNSVFSAYKDRNQIIWIGTAGHGLLQQDKSKTGVTEYVAEGNGENVLSDNVLTSVYEDSEGIIWIGTHRGGLNRLDRKINKIIQFLHNPADPYSLSNNDVRAIYEDREGNLWIGTNAGGLNRFDRSTNRFEHFSSGRKNPGVQFESVYGICKDSFDIFWLATERGIIGLNLEKKEFFNLISNDLTDNPLASGMIVTIMADHQNQLWIGTWGNGLFQFNRNTGQITAFQHDIQDSHSIGSNIVGAIYGDSNHRLWIGTDGGGLHLLDRSTGRFLHFNTDNGLPNNFVTGIVEDKNGYLWFGTHEGLSRYNPENQTFRNYDQKDGIRATEIGQGIRSRFTNELIFATMNGLLIIDPDKLYDNTRIPPVVITKFGRYNTRENPDDIILDPGITERNEIKLSYRDNILEFEFAVLDFINPSGNQYTYKLEGLSDQWIPLGHRNKLTLTNLDPGKYVLHIRGSNNSGVWNEEGKKLNLAITPPWWSTWWARVSYGLTGILFFLGFVRWRTSDLKNRQKELEQTVTERTAEAVTQRKRSEELLLNILPFEVAEELKETGHTQPVRFEEVSILFADFKEFTNIVASIPGAKLVAELDDIFQHFDDIADQVGLEKIQTVGDAYLAAGGLPKEDPDHALKCVQAGKLMIEYLNERNHLSSIKWKLRVGIHSGPITAGVVGKKKFSYDIFGDTVNIAARIESCSEEGRINVSAYTHDLIKSHFACDYRGKINAKGKGELDMYFVI